MNTLPEAPDITPDPARADRIRIVTETIEEFAQWYPGLPPEPRAA